MGIRISSRRDRDRKGGRRTSKIIIIPDGEEIDAAEEFVMVGVKGEDPYQLVSDGALPMRFYHGVL